MTPDTPLPSSDRLSDIPRTPVSLKSLSVDAKGKLARRRAVGPLGFRFHSQGHTFSCRFYERAGQAGLTIASILGTVPQGDRHRSQRSALRRLAKEAKIQGIELTLRRGGQIDIAYRIRPQIPVTGSTLITHLTLATLALGPWCQAVTTLSR